MADTLDPRSVKIKFFTTGGTIDKVYFDQIRKYEIGDPSAISILQEASASFDYEVESLLKKDSLEITDRDRDLIRERIVSDPSERIIVTHGTDSMIETAKHLDDIPGKVIVLTGAMSPAKFKETDAIFNIGSAVVAVQILPEGTHIVMSGCIFDPKRVRKNLQTSQFEHV